MKRRWMALALKVASTSDHHKFKVGSVVFRGGSVISTASNCDKMYRCAETRALKKWVDKDRYKGANLLVVRHNMGCSKPCKRCMKIIEESGIDTVYYTDWNGEIQKLKVSRI